MTTISEVLFPGCDKLIFMGLDYRFDLTKLDLRQMVILRQFYIRFKPILRFAVLRSNMDVHSRFFQRKEEKPVTVLSKNGWAHNLLTSNALLTCA